MTWAAGRWNRAGGKEVRHTAPAHTVRRGIRDPARWHVAGDRAVNPPRRVAGFVRLTARLMPGEGMDAHLPPGKSADEYYGRPLRAQLRHQTKCQQATPVGTEQAPIRAAVAG